MDSMDKPSRLRSAGIMAAVFGLGLVAGLFVGRSIKPAAANPAPPMAMLPQPFAPDGPIAEARRQQMEEMVAFLKETLELDAEQEVAFDRLHERVQSRVDSVIAEIGPGITAMVQESALELRSILNEEQFQRLLETPMPNSSPFQPRILFGQDSAGGR